MCPACMTSAVTTAALIAAGAGSAGGLAALVVARLRALTGAASADPYPKTEGEHDGSPDDRIPQ